MKLFAILIFVFCAFSTNANEYVQTSRYVEIDISPHSQQVDPLKVVIDFSFPQGIKTVGEAIHLLISPSGYKLDLKESDIAYLLFELPLPEIHKHLGPVRFKEAVSILSGKGFIPNFDETLRRISFTTESESIKLVDIAPYKKQWLARKNPSPFTLRSHAVSNPIDEGYTKYTVKEGDSVSIIAGKIGMPFTDQFSNQVVKNNPHAFIDKNPNLLLSGVTIKVPSL